MREHLSVLEELTADMKAKCPWLSGRHSGGEHTSYGERATLCNPSEKLAAGRSAAAAYDVVRHLEFDHLSQCRDLLRQELSDRRDLPEETSRFLAKDLFDKCEAITACISCGCHNAVPAMLNLEMLLRILSKAP